ncbi:imidazolonepropionase [Desulfosarcina alkanivorans]|uniref:Imidazolonepropionase n=1 Tax=Desulfosarcina alkanivorans TaxID=571177 RepID=A0A5K7YAS9_9BACT|nr:imidazolonepropionase [Desulfosarcina alkanivorans]BBO66502.1 imidazolonepropionase [Desulfosarcina alkanivorans]
MNFPVFPETVDSLWLDMRLATMAGHTPYGLMADSAMAVDAGRIVWLGPQARLPADAAAKARAVHHLEGACVTPGLIDCHTHLVYAGSRAGEFEMRLNGASYEEIARAGGGILSTVNAVRNASEADLFDQSALRLAAMQAEGVTTVEIKSGYGLNTPTELKMLRVARRLDQAFPTSVTATFLGAHALPPEYTGRPDAYIDLVVDEMMPAVAADGLAQAVDVFCERIAFTPAQTERVLSAARRLNLGVKLHAEQLSDSKGAAMAARFGALSADHLEYLDAAGAKAMAAAGTVAVLLPGAFYFLKETRTPPVDLLRRQGVAMALATDCNPGTSPTTSPLLMMNMGCVCFGLTPAESLAGFTRHAARALGLRDRGTLEVGKQADFVVWNVDEPAELAYRMGGNPCRMTVKEGAIVRVSSDATAAGR